MWILKSLSLKAKISYLVVASCIISAFAVFLISTSIARKELVKASQNQLESIASLAQASGAQVAASGSFLGPLRTTPGSVGGLCSIH